jgi:hypothetical protein
MSLIKEQTMYDYGTAGEHGVAGLVCQCQCGTEYDYPVRQRLDRYKVIIVPCIQTKRVCTNLADTCPDT